jgi:hypothetical protein
VVPEEIPVAEIDEPVAASVAVWEFGVSDTTDDRSADTHGGSDVEFDSWGTASETVTSWAPPVSRAPAAEPVQIAFQTTTVAGMALDRMKMTYALQWWGLWGGCVVLAGVLGYFVNLLLAPPLVVLASWVALVGTVGGVSHLVVQDARQGATAHWSAGWELFGRRWLSLVCGCLLMAGGVVLTATFLIGGIFAVSHVPYVGSLLGGLLVVPTFLLLLFALVLICNLHMLVVIVGVEDCSAWEALGHLTALVRRDWFALLGWSYFSPFLVTLGATLFTLVLTAAGLAGALALCGGEQLLLGLARGVSPAVVLHAASIAVISAGALAFVTVFATLQFTLLYCKYA